MKEVSDGTMQTPVKKRIAFWFSVVVISLALLIALVQLVSYFLSFRYSDPKAEARARLDGYGLSADVQLLDEQEAPPLSIQLWEGSTGEEASCAVFVWKPGWGGRHRLVYELVVPRSTVEEDGGYLSFGFQDTPFWFYLCRTNRDLRLMEPERQFRWNELLTPWAIVFVLLLIWIVSRAIRDVRRSQGAEGGTARDTRTPM